MRYQKYNNTENNLYNKRNYNTLSMQLVVKHCQKSHDLPSIGS